MDFLEIEGGVKLKGEVQISGAKNAALPLLAALLLSKTELKISNLPAVVDIKTMANLLEKLGGAVQWSENKHELNFTPATLKAQKTTANYDIVRKMRASILVLGPLLGRFGKCKVSLPGGCAIGARPVDLHIKALEQMGAQIEIRRGYIDALAPQGLKGAEIVFDKITVTGSENIIMAAAMASGKSILYNVAKEPEVVQLCEVLSASGVEISGIGTSRLEIRGSEREGLAMRDFAVIADRIEAGTYLCAGAITNSPIALRGANAEHLGAVLAKLHEIGFKTTQNGDLLSLSTCENPQSFEIITSEYPGFPTDMQAQFMALATQCFGTSVIEERLFENRFMHAVELQRMGASIALRGSVAHISGRVPLFGADVMATDLRASSALVLAALIADERTRIHRIYHLDRGYENLEGKLNALGAKVLRDSE